jgi:hypothetical protein
MPTENPRVNITFDKDNLAVLASFAKNREMSLSAAAKDLILKALELEEDEYYSKLAEIREKNTKKWLSHDNAWK